MALAQVWSALPGYTLLDQTVHRDKKRLIITEHRLLANKMTVLPTVSCVDEPGVVIVRGKLELLQDSTRWDPVVIATASLHCLARRYMRGFDCDDPSIIADLAALVEVVPNLIARGGDFRVSVPSGGEIAGEVAWLRAPGDRNVLAVHCRTFLH